MLRGFVFISPADGIRVTCIYKTFIPCGTDGASKTAIQYLPYPDFRNYHIWVGIGNPLDAFFNFIRDVGNRTVPPGRRDALY